MDEDFDFSDLQDEKDKKAKAPISKPKPATKVADDDFIFDDLGDNANKKTANKKQQKKNQSSNMNYDLLDEELEENDHPKVTAKQSTSILPPINTKKQSTDKPEFKSPSKIDHTLEKIETEKVNYFEKERIANKKQTEDFDFAVDYHNSKDTKLNSSPTNDYKSSLNLERAKDTQKKLESDVFFQESLEESPRKKEEEKQAQPEKKKVQSEEDQPLLDLEDLGNQYEEEYEDDYEEEEKEEVKLQVEEKKSPVHTKSAQRLPADKKSPLNPSIGSAQKKSVSAKKILKTRESRLTEKSKSKGKLDVKQLIPKKPVKKPNTKPVTSGTSGQQKIHKYEEQVEKAFPSTQTEEQIKKLKNDALNRLNDKIREMIKGFSNELTKMIDKNLILLRKEKGEGEIKEEIDGEHEAENQRKILEENRKNNLKQLQITENELQYYIKLEEKMKNSGEYSLRIAEETHAYKEHISEKTKDISNMKNEIDKNGKKVMKIPEASSGLTRQKSNSNFKVNLETREMYTNAKLTFDKNARKLEELEDKLYDLDTKIADASEKKADLLEKAESEGICFYSKEQKNKYDALKKRREQLATFKSKFNSSIQSKETFIQRQISDLQTLVYDMEARFDKLEGSIERSREEMISEIRRGRNSKKVPVNVKDVLSQLQDYMSSKSEKQIDSAEKLNSLTLISDNIYKREYHSNTNKNKTEEEPAKEKRIEYKNYLQEVAQAQKLAKARAKNNNSTQKYASQNNSTNNPFKRSVTPGDKPPRYSQEIKKKEIQTGKRIERLWKDNEQPSISNNPLKNSSKKLVGPNSANVKHIAKTNYDEDVGSLLKNKEITKLIDREKQKIVMEDKSTKSQSKKPFNFRSNPRDKQPKPKTQPPKTPSEEEYAQDNFEDADNKEEPSQAQSEENKDVDVFLEDKKAKDQPKTQEVAQKPSINSSPFRNIKLKKDKVQENQEEKIEIKNADNNSEEVKQSPTDKVQEKITAEQESQAIFKPKRFNVRRKNDSVNDSYMPTAVAEKKPNNDEEGNKKSEQGIHLPAKEPLKVENENIKKKEVEEAYDPFKKFIGKEEGTQDIGKGGEEGKPAQQEPPKMINFSKARNNPFKKNTDENKLTLQSKQEHVHKSNESEFILIKKPQKQLNLGTKIEKPIAEQINTIQNPNNPYLTAQNSEQPQIKREVRARKIKGPSAVPSRQTSQKNNIYDNVEDMTSNPLLQLNESPVNNQGHISSNRLSQNTEQEPNLDDMLGVKKKKAVVDEDLIIGDETVQDNSRKAIGGQKKNPFANKKKKDDFFDDMEL